MKVKTPLQSVGWLGGSSYTVTVPRRKEHEPERSAMTSQILLILIALGALGGFSIGLTIGMALP